MKWCTVCERTWVAGRNSRGLPSRLRALQHEVPHQEPVDQPQQPTSHNQDRTEGRNAQSQERERLGSWRRQNQQEISLRQNFSGGKVLHHIRHMT